MSKALKKIAPKWAPEAKIAAKAVAKKRPTLFVVTPDHKAEGPAKGARELQSWVQQAQAVRPKQIRKVHHVRRHVDVLADGGHVLASYSLVLEAGCLEAEYEEVALVLAEQDGLVTEEEIVTLRARCLH